MRQTPPDPDNRSTAEKRKQQRELAHAESQYQKHLAREAKRKLEPEPDFPVEVFEEQENDKNE